MVRFTVHNLGEHTIDQMVVYGPFKEVVMEMADMFLATQFGDPDGDIDLLFAQYIIKFSGGQGEILKYQPHEPGEIH